MVFHRFGTNGLKIIYQGNYQTYKNALEMSKLSTLKIRYQNLLQKFAIKCVKNQLTSHMIPPAKQKDWARNQEKFQVPFARKQRFFKSSIPTMARMLNKI